MTPDSAQSQPLAPPASAGSWRLGSTAQRIEPAGIFDYMDGGGELYLGYRFDHIDVYEYPAPAGGEDAILVEVYWLAGSDDAYGLLSQDWGGEAVSLAADWPAGERRARYGSGLLRVWTDNVFVRVMASLETPASRAAVLTIGRHLVADRPLAAAPDLLRSLPTEAGGCWRLLLDRHVFLRSHLVLNSVYFLATANVLDLGRDVEAVIAPYDDGRAQGPRSRVWLLVARYPDASAAQGALAHFAGVYLKRAAPTAPAAQGEQQVEDGWAAWRLTERSLALVFAAPSGGAAKEILEAVAANTTRAAAQR